MQVIVDDLLTNYVSFGKGKAVLLLHGWGDNSSGMRALQQTLAKSYKVLAVDLPGFGGSQAPRGAWDLDAYANFLQTFLQKIEAGAPHAVIGHSNGGAVAIRAISLGKLQPQKLVLMAASGIRSGKSVRRIMLKTLAMIGNVVTVWMPERYRQSLRKSLYGAAGSDALVVESMRDTFDKVVKQDVQQDAAQLTLPTLLIYAENDKDTPLEHGRLYHELIKGSKLTIIPSAGHFVHLDEPDQVAVAIEAFLQ